MRSNVLFVVLLIVFWCAIGALWWLEPNKSPLRVRVGYEYTIISVPVFKATHPADLPEK